MSDGLNAAFDPDADAYYFNNGSRHPSVKQIGLGSRQVILDIDHYGQIIGIEVF